MKEEMNRLSIGKINGVEIFAIEKEDGTILVPIKPICSALGIDDKTQRDKINEDEDLSSVGGIIPSTGADGKPYEMLCLPKNFIYGWLFTISPSKVAPEARESVRRYRRQCFDALSEYFDGKSRRQEEFIDMERTLMKEKKELGDTLSNLMQSVSDVKARIKSIDGKFSELQSQRLNPTPSLFD